MPQDTETFRRSRSMKLEILVIVFKGLTVTAVGFFTPWSAALAQWIGSESWPPRIVWLGVLLPASVVGGASALNAFLSSSYNDFKQQKRANDSGQTQVVKTEPTAPSVEPTSK